MPTADSQPRVSLRLGKDGDARFLSQLDFVRLVERSLRRSGLPVRYTEGFNPRFRLTFADALPVGVASAGEWVTVQLTTDVALDTIRTRLAPALPEGVALRDVRAGEPPPARGPVRYRIEVLQGEPAVAQALTALLERDEFTVPDPRRDRTVDARALLAQGSVRDGHLEVDLVVLEGRSPRPGPVVEALKALVDGPPPEFGVVTRLAADERSPGDRSWPDDARVPSASSSSTPRSPRRVASRSSTAASSTSTT